MRTMGVTDHQRTFVRTFFRQRQGYVSFDPPATSMADQRGIKMVRDDCGNKHTSHW